MRLTRPILLLAALATIAGFLRSTLVRERAPLEAREPTAPLQVPAVPEPVARVIEAGGTPARGVKLLDRFGRSWSIAGADGLIALPISLHGQEVTAIDVGAEPELGRFVLELRGPKLQTIEVIR